MKVYPRAHWYLTLALAVAVGGFVPSYWSQDLSVFRPAIHWHAASATLWFLILILQPWLVNSGRVTAHRTIGCVALATAVLLVVTAALITPANLELETANADLPYVFVYWDVATIALFAVYVILGMRHRRSVQLHARYMLATAFVPLLPALARGLYFYGIVNNFTSALYVGNAIVLAVLALLIYDDHKRGKIRAPYVGLYVAFTLLGASVEVVGAAAWWQASIDAAVVPVVWTTLVAGCLGAYLGRRLHPAASTH